MYTITKRILATVAVVGHILIMTTGLDQAVMYVMTLKIVASDTAMDIMTPINVINGYPVIR